MRLRSYLLLPVVSAVVPIVAFACLLSITLWRHERDATYARMRDTARALAHAVDTEFLASVTTLEALATSRSLDRGDVAAFRAEATRVLDSQQRLGWQTIILVGPDERTQLMNLQQPPSAALPPVVDRESNHAVFATGHPVVSNLLRSFVTGKLTFSVRVPVIRDGRVRYAVTAGIDPAVVSAILTAQGVAPPFLSAIFDRNGLTVARTRAAEQFVGQPAGATMAQAMRESTGGTIRVTTREGLRLDSTFVRAPFSGWTATYSAEASAVEAPLRRSLALLFGGGVALGVAGLGVAVVIARRLARPLDDLRARAVSFGHGARFEARPAPVTELTELERALAAASIAREDTERAHRHVAALVEASDDAIVGLDVDGRVTSWNPGAERLYGYSVDEVVGRPTPAFAVPPDRVDEGRENLERLRRGERIPPYDTVRLRKDGGRVEVSLSIAPVRDESGAVIGASSVSRDISARRAIEAALRDERQTIETIHRVGQVLSAERDMTELVQALTDAATRLTGAQFGAFFHNVVDARGESYQLFTLAGAPRAAFEGFAMPRNTALFAPTFRGEAVVRVDDVTRDPRYGSMAPHHGLPPGHLPVRSYLAVPVMSRAREVLGGLFFGHERTGVFTERAEQLAVGLAAQAAIAMENARAFGQLERARTLAEAANRSKDEFLAVLSHELRTPLNAVLGWTRMARSDTLDETGRRRALEVIERNAVAQLRLVEDLLDMSRIISGKLVLEMRPVDLAATIEAAMDALRLTADAKGVALHAVLDGGTGPVTGDAARLQQVVWNLLANAIKFTPRGGRVDVTLTGTADRATILVRDTGIGIEPAMLPFVFDRFRQADSSSTRAHGGLGLGLALVRHVVELHGGTVDARSDGRDAGARFTVTLPIATVRADLGIPPVAIAGADDLAGIRVLVVDDDVDARELFTAMLGRSGASVRAAVGAEETLSLVTSWRPDVLLCDIEMPGENGYTLLARIRALGPARGGDVPAAAVTAYGRPQDRDVALAAGFALHIAKPVDQADLARAVAALARGPRATGPR